MALTGGAEAAKEVDLERGRLVEFIRGQFRCPLIKVVGDTHRADRVRA